MDQQDVLIKTEFNQGNGVITDIIINNDSEYRMFSIENDENDPKDVIIQIAIAEKYVTINGKRLSDLQFRLLIEFLNQKI